MSPLAKPLDLLPILLEVIRLVGQHGQKLLPQVTPPYFRTAHHHCPYLLFLRRNSFPLLRALPQAGERFIPAPIPFPPYSRKDYPRPSLPDPRARLSSDFTTVLFSSGCVLQTNRPSVLERSADSILRYGPGLSPCRKSKLSPALVSVNIQRTPPHRYSLVPPPFPQWKDARQCFLQLANLGPVFPG